MPAKETLRKLIDKLPYIRKLRAEVETYKTRFPPGHYYSPIPDQAEVLARQEWIFNTDRKDIGGVDLNEAGQLALLEQAKGFYDQLPFTQDKQTDARYYFGNGAYCHSDAIFLYLVMRQFRPGKIIEVGSGFSSAAMLDVNDRFFDGNIACTFIEPYPDTLSTLLSETDKTKHTVLQQFVQDVNIDVFQQLGENDILLIDSSHVSKTGSDLNYLMFDVLPVLKRGVLVHFHDVAWPFEYPQDWVTMGRAWNEAYLVRAFLAYNSGFKIRFFNTFLEQYHESWFKTHMPLCLENRGGSIWLEKLA